MYVSRPTGTKLEILEILFYSGISVVLFDTPLINKCLYTSFLLSPQFCYIKGFICDLFVARNDL